MNGESTSESMVFTPNEKSRLFHVLRLVTLNMFTGNRHSKQGENRQSKSRQEEWIVVDPKQTRWRSMKINEVNIK